MLGLTSRTTIVIGAGRILDSESGLHTDAAKARAGVGSNQSFLGLSHLRRVFILGAFQFLLLFCEPKNRTVMSSIFCETRSLTATCTIPEGLYAIVTSKLGSVCFRAGKCSSRSPTMRQSSSRWSLSP